MIGTRPDYLFVHGRSEHERLLAQSALIDGVTRELFAAAMIAPGSWVLDLGCGAGSVSLLAADVVGSTGSVLGIDTNPETVAMAAARAARLGVDNVEFRVADVQTLDGVGTGFDAVVGRLILMYLADPVAALRVAAERVRPGGLVCFHEADFTYDWSVPMPPLWSYAYDCLHETMRRAGVEPRMAHRLHATFRAAGLPAPRMRVGADAWGGDSLPAYGWADVVLGALPLMERFGVTTAEELGADTLRERLRAELRAVDGVMISAVLTGAGARRVGAGS